MVSVTVPVIPPGHVGVVRRDGRVVMRLAAGTVASAYEGELTVEAVPETVAPPPTSAAPNLIRRELAASDGPTVRVLEDLVAALLSKGILAEDDLPEAARARLAERRQLRKALGDGRGA